MSTEQEQATKIVGNSKPPAAGKGRPKGAMNKNTKLLKDAILEAAARAGDKWGEEGMVSYLEHQADENPTAFLSLMGRVLPLQVKAEIEGGIEHVVRVQWKAPQ